MSCRTPRYTNAEVLRIADDLSLKVWHGKGDHIHIQLGNEPWATIRNGKPNKIANPVTMKLIRRAIQQASQAAAAPSAGPGHPGRRAVLSGTAP